MDKTNYLLIESGILPEVYLKVVKAKKLLLTGGADSVSSAVKMAGISRSAYYKYKDKIFEYSKPDGDTATLNLKLEDSAGVLSSVMNELYVSGANILSVNQTVPVNGVADVTVSARIPDARTCAAELEKRIKKINGVLSVVAGGQK